MKYGAIEHNLEAEVFKMELFTGRPKDVIKKFLPAVEHDYVTVHLVGED